MRLTNFKILALIVCLLFVYLTEALAGSSILISLIYPQKSNAPKREIGRIEEPLAVTGEVMVNVKGIKSEQLRNHGLYVEYFLDENLVYSTEDKKEISSDRLKSLGFVLDTHLFSDGLHTLIVNLWDRDGPSAIGIRKLIIQNEQKNED